MRKTIAVPSMGERKATETLVNFWYVAEGEAFKAGDDLAELVTDKAAFNLPADVDGKLVKILKPEGAKVAEGDALAEIETGAE